MRFLGRFNEGLLRLSKLSKQACLHTQVTRFLNAMGVREPNPKNCVVCISSDNFDYFFYQCCKNAQRNFHLQSAYSLRLQIAKLTKENALFTNSRKKSTRAMVQNHIVLYHPPMSIGLKHKMALRGNSRQHCIDVKL